MVYSDFMDLIDRGNVILLGLLDMSSAFDTVDYSILLERIESAFGIQNTAHRWISSYPSDRTQTVVVDSVRSDIQHLERGVPQGSVLGPMLFLLYTSEILEIIRSFKLDSHAYADDTQLYFHSAPNEVASVAPQLLACVEAIGQWMSSNRLKLNPDKTEFIWLASPYHLKNIYHQPLIVGDTTIEPSKVVRDLGIFFDNTLNLYDNVSRTVQSCFYQLRQLKHIRRSLSRTNIKTLLHAFVTSRLDYCNSLLAGQPAHLLDKLQLVQNAAARLYAGTPRNSHVTAVLRDELHWLRIPQRIDFKLCMLVYRCLHGNAPLYLAEWCVRLHDNSDSRISSSRSAAMGNLVVPRSRTKTYGSRSFRLSGPTVWNALPSSLKIDMPYTTFKSKLKTHFFTLSYASL